jgi:hypothetical protein
MWIPAWLWVERTESNPLGVPIFALEYSIYAAVICQAIFVCIIVTLVRIVQKFEHGTEAHGKFIKTMASMVMFNWILLGNFIFNYLNIDSARRIFMISSLVILPAIYLLYQGMVTAIRESKVDEA